MFERGACRFSRLFGGFPSVNERRRLRREDLLGIVEFGALKRSQPVDLLEREFGEKFEEARDNYEKALKIDPNYAYAHLNYGILLDLYLGELDNALDHYQTYQKLAPEEDKEVEKWIVDLERRIKRASN